MNLPEFDRPPVSEIAIGVQFAPVANFTSAHYGLFWKGHLDPSWVKAQDAPRLMPQFEKFGEGSASPPAAPFFIQSTPQPDRILLINEDDDRILQIQGDRFHYNWRKRQREYPSFDKIFGEFRDYLEKFEGFLAESGLGKPLFNQWELTYFNAIRRGDLWDEPSDWAKIFPGLFTTIDSSSLGLILAPPMSTLKFEIPQRRGNLYIMGSHSRLEDGHEALQLNFAARGPLLPGDSDWDLTTSLNIGHSALVRAFRELASPSARTHWGER
jgi:uncharacterized protein (TIGR04255 family)